MSPSQTREDSRPQRCCAPDHGVVFLGATAAYSVRNAQPQRLHRFDPIASGSSSLFRRSPGRSYCFGKVEAQFRIARYGYCARGLGSCELRHHHLLVDTELPPLNKPIPNDFNHLHFGAGQTETEITLKPGEHTLQLLMGDKDHIPHTPPVMSPRIRVRVPAVRRQRRVTPSFVSSDCKMARFFLRMRPSALASSTWGWHLRGSTRLTPATITS